MEDPGNDADDAGCNVVGNDSSGIEGVETLRPPGWLHRFEMACDSVGIRDPHAGTENTGEVKRSEPEAAETGKEQMDTENLGEIKCRFTGARVLPDLEIPVRPVPDGRKHQKATENDVGCGHTFETPETWVNTRFSRDAPTTPAAGDPETGHEGHHEHALTPHRVQNRI